MDRIAKALAAHDEVYAEISRALFGDGADELIAKMNPEGSDLSAGAKKKKFERRQAQVGLATNVVGITAGAAGLGAAAKEYKLAKPGLKLTVPKHKLEKPKSRKLLGAAVGLQAANLAGDAIANRVLARSAKKDEVHLKKMDDAKPKMKYKLIAQAADRSIPIARDAVETGTKKAKNKLAKSDQLDIVWQGEISKVDDDKRQVFGFASVVEVNGEPVVDRQGDYISIEEVEKAAYDYVHKSRKGGDMHKRVGTDPHHVSDMIESFVITDEKVAKMGLPEDTPRGWWVGYQVHDDETWNLVKSGERTGFSIHGKGERVSKVLA